MGLVKKVSQLLLDGVRRHKRQSRRVENNRQSSQDLQDLHVHLQQRPDRNLDFDYEDPAPVETWKLKEMGRTRVETPGAIAATGELEDEEEIKMARQEQHQRASGAANATITSQVDGFRKPGLVRAGPRIHFVENGDKGEHERDNEEEEVEEVEEEEVDEEEVGEEEEEEEDESQSDEQYETGDEEETEGKQKIDESVAEDMRKLEESFRGISRRYRLMNRIGEGTFSTVYKAEQLPSPPDQDHENGVYKGGCSARDLPNKRRKKSPCSQPVSRSSHRRGRKPQYVALKKIYVTSSPFRIQNELEILHALRHSPHICPLLTAFRHLDQVVAVLPYFRHVDFRLCFRDFIISDMRDYFGSLLSALHFVHSCGVLHRDIKPTNFLYDHTRRGGVLVDFGLAEKQGTDWQPCLCTEHREVRMNRFMSSVAYNNAANNNTTTTNTATTGSTTLLSAGYPKNDPRPARRANRAGTRGFRAPEVLFKCTSQTTKIDIWSTGVILLTLLGRRFPFFNSTDDVDALIEIASIFGRRRMRACAALHGSIFETSIDTIGDRGFTLEKIVFWSSCREGTAGNGYKDYPLSPAYRQAIGLLEQLLELDPRRRLSAKEALNHDFFVKPVVDEEEEEEEEALEEDCNDEVEEGEGEGEDG